jgi:biopolymer transport protein ExbB
MMQPLFNLVGHGGPAVVAIMVLSVVLYARCFQIMLGLRRAPWRAAAEAVPPALRVEWLQRRKGELRDDFRQHRVTLGAMIAAAPLLGLLGTVSGMEKTFGSLAAEAGQKSMEGLASGISEVLVATESGLTVALPAMLLVYLAHREMNRQIEAVNRLERGLRRAEEAS